MNFKAVCERPYKIIIYLLSLTHNRYNLICVATFYLRENNFYCQHALCDSSYLYRILEKGHVYEDN